MLFVNSGVSLADGSLVIHDAWIKHLPPVVPMRAGYLTINNHSTHALEVTHAESDAFMQVEIHENIEKNGVMVMQSLSSLPVPAGATVKLIPGGIHLMMIQPRQSLQPGDRVPVTLHFGDGNSKTLQMLVKK